MVKIRTTPSSSSENNNNSSNKKKKAAVVVNKGAWSAEEDKKLVDYVNTHGDKKWRSLPVDAGLNRCGKSCRLRWLNYLRPGIKRGNISEDEEDLIIRLHNLLGNRWSLIAGRLPGRTDNEIKNHWNTHLSKKSLTIDELNLKLNQKLESNTNTHTTSIVQTTSSNIPVTPDVDWAGTSQSNDTFKRSYENGMLSKPTDGFLNDDLDINGFFDFSVDSDLPASYPFVGSSESRLPVDYNSLGDEIYHKFLDSELYMHGSSIGNLDEQFNSKLDIERLLYSDDDNMFLSFS